jgi:ATP-grasp domain, R2K clade family 3
LRLPSRSRGTVIVRRLVRLRHTRTSGRGFPAGRAFRVFLHGSRVLNYGYYWDGDDALAALSADEERAVLDLARLAAIRLGVPFVAVDIGQEESGRWIVIEVNDAQVSGHGHNPLLRLWNRISAIS